MKLFLPYPKSLTFEEAHTRVMTQLDALHTVIALLARNNTNNDTLRESHLRVFQQLTSNVDEAPDGTHAKHHQRIMAAKKKTPNSA